VRDRVRVNHERGAIEGFLSQLPSGTPVALETVGNLYWIVDDIEAAGCVPLLAHAARAKAMVIMGIVTCRFPYPRQDIAFPPLAPKPSLHLGH